MSYSSKISNVIDSLILPDDTNKEIIRLRFVDEVEYYEKKRDSTKRYYNIFRFIVTVGSILLPAILSIGQMDPTKLPKNFGEITYWSSWSISLMVTISNGFLQLFSLDKNYFNYSLVVEQLKTEGWQFFGLSGKYDDHDTHNKKSYKEFCKAIESIKRKQVEQEFSSGKGDTKKKKQPEFNFAKEFNDFQGKSTLEKPLLLKGNTENDKNKDKGKDIEHGNFLGNIASNVISNVANNVASNVLDKVSEGLEDVIDNTDNVSEIISENTDLGQFISDNDSEVIFNTKE